VIFTLLCISAPGLGAYPGTVRKVVHGVQGAKGNYRCQWLRTGSAGFGATAEKAP